MGCQMGSILGPLIGGVMGGVDQEVPGYMGYTHVGCYTME